MWIKKITNSICFNNEIWLKKVAVMAKLSVEQTILKAKSHGKKGEIEAAQKLYQADLQTFPKNKRVQQGLAALNKPKQSTITQGPPQETINQLVNLYNQGQLTAVIEQAEVLTEQYPKVFFVLNILGSAYKGLGKSVEASVVFRKVTELNPTYANGHSNLGVTLQEQGKLEEAIEAYKKALSIKPDYAGAYNNMGNALKGQGKVDEAIASFNKALLLKPDYAEAYNNLGITLKVQGKLEKATASYNKALSLKPDYAEAYNNMGNTLQGQGKLDEAIASFNKALSLKPDNAVVYNNIGNALRDQGKLEEAIKAYTKALTIKPDYAAVYNNVGNALKKQGKPNEAIASFNKALLLKPDYAEAHNNLGITLKVQGKLEEAMTSYNKALSLKPNYADAYYNMGNTLQDQGKLEEAVQAYTKALAINSNYAEAYNNMGNVLQGQGKLDEAIEAYNKALALKPDYAEAYNNMGRTYYLKGEIQKGLELLEYRFKKQKAPTRAPREKLYWNGSEPIKGKEFLVYEEQGLGDIIQFCRYLPTLVKQGAKVTFKVTQKLHALLRTLDSDIILVDRLPDESQIDFEAPLMSLPHLLNISLETIPSIETYLSADYAKVVSWGKLLNTQKFKIGICWQGSKNKIDIGRSFPLSLFEGISKLPNVELISLHKGEGEKQIQEIKFNLTTLGSNFDASQDAFLDTSAVIENCDLVITSDTAVAHLAGSLGCTTWLILKYIPDWRWMFNRDDCPWYPTMTLFRQKTPGNWADVFSTVEQRLLSKLEEGK